MKADLLREKFLSFFKARKHKIVEGDSLVPAGDPTVLFTPAGMNQFKREFLGAGGSLKRAATSQRCLRTDDLEKVGRTSGHHTFFEMLGNFSFGDYFKKEAISWAWEFLTEELKIDKQNLWVSVYKDDSESYAVWKEKIKIPAERIIKLGDKENFWPSEAKEKGPDGPCGPCSEIFFDFGKAAGCGRPDCRPGCSCNRFVEVWNLVFTQFNRKEKGRLEPLPKKNIDTGMGLERLAAVVQGKQSNFQTDLFEPIIKEIERYVTANPAKKKRNELVYAVADHIRAVVFCIYDGVLPSNESRGYVVRKIIRKSVEHLRSLGIEGPFLNKLVPLVALAMQVPYPELRERQEDIAQVVLNEEKNFIAVLKSSDQLVQRALGALVENSGRLSANDSRKAGALSFNLYDTYGVPLGLTKDWLETQGIRINEKEFDQGFNCQMQRQKERSKSQSKMKGVVFELKGLDPKLKETKFVGYKENSCSAKILAVLKDETEIVLDQTPFYAESGGQVGDTGKLISGENVFEVFDTQKVDNLILHIGKVGSGSFKIGDKVTAEINIERRLNIARNHTATHILQAALRKVLGAHVQQQGSLVAEDKFRFDFTHFKGLSKDEIARVEEVANRYISKGEAVSSNLMPLKEAKRAGALAFFEEKYAETVRVVNIGDISKELCGGTHLDKIGKIGLIKIISERSVASGIRRIEAVTGVFAEQFIKEQKERAVEDSKKQDQLKQLKEQQKQRSLELDHGLEDAVPRLINNGREINGVKVVSALEAGLEMPALRLLADKVKEGLKHGVIALGSQDNKQRKAYLVIAVTQDLLADKGLDAGALIRQVAPLIGGSGGGRKDFAQAGGSRPQNLPEALEELKKALARRL